MTRFLSKERVLQIHESQIEKFGGLSGIRDVGLLESALAMPQMSFGGHFLHGDVCEQAAAYLFHITSNHPFLDGNKRTGAATALIFLQLNGKPYEGDKDAFESLVLAVANGELEKPAIAEFFRKNCRKQ